MNFIVQRIKKTLQLINEFFINKNSKVDKLLLIKRNLITKN